MTGHVDAAPSESGRAGDSGRAGNSGRAGDSGRADDIEAAGDSDAAPDVRTRLEAIRSDARLLADRLLLDMQAVSDARESSNVDDEHDPEGATIAFERSQLEAIRRSTLERMAAADAALARLVAGTYGVCEVCGRPIAPGRLRARPTATRCIEHAV